MFGGARSTQISTKNGRANVVEYQYTGREFEGGVNEDTVKRLRSLGFEEKAQTTQRVAAKNYLN